MQITFLIGNGFDLACGLKSSYPNVYEKYIKEESKTEAIKKFKEDLIKEKTKEKWGNWSNFEIGMAEYAKSFNDEKEFIGCVSDFKAFLKKHLIEEQQKFFADYENVKKYYGTGIMQYIREGVYNFYTGLTKKIERKIEECGDATSWSYKFINFNYTGVLKKVIFENVASKTEILNIHGDLINQDVILGVDNVEQIKSNFNISKKGKRVFVKPYLNDENDPNKVEKVKDIIKTSSYICLFGISLGDSDLTWKNEIVSWLKENENHHLFIFDYNCSRINIADLSLRLNEEEDRKSEKMKQLGLEQEEKIFEQIHMPIGKLIFEIGAFITDYHKKEAKKGKTA